MCRHYQPVLVPNSGRYLCVSDLLTPSSHVARLNGMSPSAFSLWWRKETRKQFGRSLRWPYLQLCSVTFCADFASNLKACPVCTHLCPETRLEMIYHTENVSIPAQARRYLWFPDHITPFSHPQRPNLTAAQMDILWKDIHGCNLVGTCPLDVVWHGNGDLSRGVPRRDAAEVLRPVVVDVSLDGVEHRWIDTVLQCSPRG